MAEWVHVFFFVRLIAAVNDRKIYGFIQLVCTVHNVQNTKMHEMQFEHPNGLMRSENVRVIFKFQTGNHRVQREICAYRHHNKRSQNKQ